MKAKINPFLGTWHITKMEVWDQNFVNLEVRGHFTFEKDGLGDFQFGAVQGEMDCRLETGEGEKKPVWCYRPSKSSRDPSGCRNFKTSARMPVWI